MNLPCLARGMTPWHVGMSFLSIVLVLGLTPACGSTEGDDGAVGSAVEDTDTGGGDLGNVTEDVVEDVAEDTGPEPEDVPTLDDIGPACPGGAGCDCSENKDCDSAWCIDTDAGLKCAQECIETCDEGFKCAPAGSGDSISICVPKWGKLCNPCLTNGECVGPGNGNAICIDQEDAGSFCGTACADSDGCPSSHECKTVSDVNGKESKACVAKNGSACTCSPKAIKAELSTSCWVTAGGAKCPGERKCLPEGAPGAPTGGGLSNCLAPDPEAEKCDAKDNDCDGDTDESTCDDDNPCTDDNCGGAKGCGYTNNEADCDADSSICTVKDLCKNGNCVKGDKLDCDDKNPCTSDTCDPTKGCEYGNVDNAPCNADDNPCTPTDSCKDGACEASKPKSCDSGDLCTVGKCNLADGTCKYTSKKGNPCNDGDPCTLDETCDANDLCQAKSVNKCDDSKPCTTDSCKSGVGCAHVNNTSPCDDGDKCTADDTCKDGSCAGAAINVKETCDDGKVCTKDSCSKTEGCKNDPLTATPCDDGNPCTEGDTCAAGKCEKGSNKCDCKNDADCSAKEDGNKCNGTLICDTSKPPFQCVVDPNTVVKCDTSLSNQCQTMACNPKAGKCELDYKQGGTSCDADKDVCTAKDACDGKGKCLKGANVDCNDKNSCTSDSCDPKEGCKHAANTNACDADNNACTVNDTCKSKVCVPGPAKLCNDNEPCTADSCNKATGQCVNKPSVNKLCNDDNACTVDDKCGKDEGTGLFTCLAGSPKVCNDGNPCTNDACDSKTGCTVKAKGDGALCNDNNECTASDVCKSALCKGTPIDVAKSCDDGNVCTIDKCDPKTGCTSTAKNSGPCDDGNACTNGDSCSKGKCAPGTNICGCNSDNDCAKQEDGNLCNGTLFCDKVKVPFQCKIKPISVVKCDVSLDGFCQKNLCDPKTGKCALDKKADNTPCNSDNSVCTTSDACKNGICKAGAPLKCDDGNPCTADSCDAKAGCKTVKQGGPCNADDNACTVNDFCTDGLCKVGKKKTCDDGEDCTADSCGKLDGKCLNKNLVKSCSDNNQCTKGDVCGTDKKSGKYTCLSGAAVSCDDGNICTNDSCDPQAGCKFAIDVKTLHNCYTGPKGTEGVGECKAGKAACKSDGTLGACVGDVKPAKEELCDGKDNNCNKTTDEGCAPTGFVARFGSAVVDGKGSKYTARALAGGSSAAGSPKPAAGAKYAPDLGFYRWLQAVLGK